LVACFLREAFWPSAWPTAAAALFVFFAAAAGAGVVAPNFGFGAYGFFDGWAFCARPGCGDLAGIVNRLDGHSTLCWTCLRALLDAAKSHIGSIAVYLAIALGRLAALNVAGLGIDAQLKEIAQGLLTNAGDEAFEDVEGAPFVLDERVLAADADKTYAVFKLVDLV
jgi:hypothetical protein